VLPRSHKDTARKAFERVTKSVLPASHKALQRALEAEAKSYRKSVDELDKRARDERAAAIAAKTTDGDVDEDIHEPVDGGELDEDLDVDVGELDD